MLPQKPAHVPQEVWDLELPSILGLAHPQATLDDEDMDDADQKNLSSHDTEALPQPASFLASTTLASSSAPTSTLEVAQVSSSTMNPQAMLQTAPAASAASGLALVVDSDTDVDREDPKDQNAPDQVATQLCEAPCFTDGNWSAIWNMDRPAQGLITYELNLDGVLLPPAPKHDAPVMEWLAYYVCSRRSCTTEDLRHLCQQVPSQTSAKRRRLTTSDGDTGRLQRSFSTGAYSAGGCHGVQRHTINFPWTSCWLTSMVRAAAPSHLFSTCSLLHNVMHYKHTDSRNAPNTQNVIIPCDFWRGGQLWLADPSGSVHLDASSGPGIMMAITRPCVVLNPTTPHATYPWSHGDRTILVAYHARGLEALTSDQRATLAGLGFRLLPLRDVEA